MLGGLAFNAARDRARKPHRGVLNMASPSIQPDVTFDFRDAGVLMVDQSAGFMDIMAQMLLGFGFKSFSRFVNLEVYREQAQGLAPDLVLIDPFQQREAVMSFIQEVREREAVGGPSMLVIVVTSKPSTEVVRTARESGADYVVAKPFSPKVLLDRILWSANSEASGAADGGETLRMSARQALQ